MVFHWRLRLARKQDLKVSHLFYAFCLYGQCQAIVKLPGSFRLAVGNRHLHRYCIFTELFLETVPQSLRLSCASELTRQGISLDTSLVRRTLSSSKFYFGAWRLVSEDSKNLDFFLRFIFSTRHAIFFMPF